MFSDFICPFCYIGFETVRKLQPEFGFELDLRGFQIHPEWPAKGLPLSQHPRMMDPQARRLVWAHIQELAEAAGVMMKAPDVLANSRLALQAAEFARENGRGDTFDERVFRAYFSEGLNIGLHRDALQARGLTLMDVVHALNTANLIIPAGDAKIGSTDYFVYSNSMIENPDDINQVPVKIGRDQAPDFLGDVGHAEDAAEIQQNIVRIDGQRSVYIPVMKQGSANTIAVVQGVKAVLPQITDLPKGMKVNAIFGQDTYIKAAVESLEHEAVSGAGTRFAHDPDLPRQFSLDHRDFPFDSTVHFGGRLWTHDEWFNHQHHDPWRLCARDWPSAR